MQVPELVEKILQLSALGWGKKRIAKELGTTPKTVRRYVRQQGWQAYKTPKRPRKLDGLENWLEKSFRLHKGNAAVVRQELLREHQIDISANTVQEPSARHRKGDR